MGSCYLIFGQESSEGSPKQLPNESVLISCVEWFRPENNSSEIECSGQANWDKTNFLLVL